MPTPPLPETLRAIGEESWHAFLSAAGEQGGGAAAWAEEGTRVFALSDFVARVAAAKPQVVSELMASGDLERDYSSEEFGRRTAAALAAAADEAALIDALRQLRRREMVRIAWRDLAGRAELRTTMTELSRFAEAVVEHTLERLHQWQGAKYGEPLDGAGRSQSLVVVAMGKLGAGELNFSSDIDLIFAFPRDGETVGGRRAISHQEFFIRLGQRLIHVLTTPTPDGFVFRVDMRLRPFGASGPLAVSFDAMEEYYQNHGRDWERYAWIKARPVAGDAAAREQLMAALRPFVYRRYLDYGAYQALRDMKALVDQEVRRKGLDQNIKIGRGGIRSIEFIGQAFQLIRGGRDTVLQEPALCTVLDLLAAQGLLPADVVAGLQEAYAFLRNTEHRLQEADDRQTQALPQDDLGRARLAAAMGYEGWATFLQALDGHRDFVEGCFGDVFTAPDEEEPEAISPLRALWEADPPHGEAAETLLRGRGYDDPGAALGRLRALKESYAVRAMSAQGRRRLDRLVPLVLEAAGAHANPQTTLARLLDLVQAVARRSVYIALLAEHPVAFEQLVKLCSSSPWISAHITRFPILLDELLDPRTLYNPPDREGLTQELALLMDNVAPGDTEQEMDTLRLYGQTNVLRVAAADIAGVLPLMKVSDHLSDIAEVILDTCLKLAWRDTTRRHGVPTCVVDGERREAGFLIVAYGKLGGLELGYGSDLDLVFLHGSAGTAQHTDGAKQTDNDTFFARLGKRLTHLLTTHTAAGTLYEVDLRLRPSGASGLLVGAMEAFADYQRRRAWTWEHQALVRARPVVGDAHLRERFEAIRREVLCQPREPKALQLEVREMRERMRRELAKGTAELFDLKQDRGGIADIEFMVQYGVLLWAATHPAVVRHTDNIRILEAFSAQGLMPAADVGLLADAYRAYRGRGHRCALAQVPALVPHVEFQGYAAGVAALWERMMEA
ncbi:MAG: bifunctional [glutamate--ammonia ligase]-adenylyl-L-tyrosine phosphorylase/[glutamate--ammonia-ligase] adenylyltransferase [Gammaproteobacteria bacterium]|nr:bifunctional [glutamate--ammonia ligase]-adenylyl-L-tyrosine phosphorylase/[glutamate--ammonia-ligase] adenylyltransferase [Gammaproteobacteria bacterium]